MSDKRKLGKANEKPKVFSLSDIKDDSHSSDDEKQTFYAGGEKSGTSIQGGGRNDSKKSKEADDIMRKILSQASSEEPSKKKGVLFSGSGRKLNGISKIPTHEMHEQQESDIAMVNLIFWSEGFTIGNGPLQQFDDPHSLRLLDSIRSGNVSARDLGINANEVADIKIIQLPNENFDENKRDKIVNMSSEKTLTDSVRPTFSGSGEKLGNAPIESVVPDLGAHINETIINTRIQIVTPNGSRHVISLPARSQISELYAAIKLKTGAKSFVLKTTNPSKIIPEDLNAFIFQIGVLNSTIVLEE